MQSAIELIVGVYVRQQKRQVLEDMLQHRQRLLADLNSRSFGYDLGRPIEQVGHDIAVIEAGLTQLTNQASAPAPRVEWSS